MLRRLQRKKLFSEINRERGILVILSPNYEQRSLYAAFRFCRLIELLKEAGYKQPVSCLLLTLRGEHPKEMLDALRAENINRATSFLEASGIPFKQTTLDYPHLNSRQLEEALKSRIVELSSEVSDVWIDISCLPRTAIYLMLSMFLSDERPELGTIRGREVGALYVMYTWADKYPVGTAPELTGDIIGALTRLPFRELVGSKSRVGLSFGIGGNGYDAALLYSQAKDFSIRADDVSRTITALITKHDLLTSWNKVSSHYSLLRSAGAAGDRIQYAFSVADASLQMIRYACDRAESDVLTGSSLFGVAPFGPKPIGVAGFLAVRAYRLHVLNLLGQGNSHASSCAADVLYAGTDQYTSVYSIGARHTDIYRVETPIDPVS